MHLYIHRHRMFFNKKIHKGWDLFFLFERAHFSYIRLCKSLMGSYIKKCVRTKVVGNWFLHLKISSFDYLNVAINAELDLKKLIQFSQKAPLNKAKIRFSWSQKKGSFKQRRFRSLWIFSPKKNSVTVYGSKS